MLSVFGLGSLFIIFNSLNSGVVDGFVDQHKMEVALEVLACICITTTIELKKPLR